MPLKRSAECSVNLRFALSVYSVNSPADALVFLPS
jgi:hypothetical protein